MLDYNAARSPHLEQVLERLRGGGFLASIEQVAFELQRGGNEMLRVRMPE